jgi:hypothetical protein
MSKQYFGPASRLHGRAQAEGRCWGRDDALQGKRGLELLKTPCRGIGLVNVACVGVGL